MRLEEVEENNIYIYKIFEENCDLFEYMSRITPDKGADFVKWYYIVEDQKYIGAVWVEKYHINDFAKLGVFIADIEYRHKGIGTSAIRECIGKNKFIQKFRLNVRKSNYNAIECYKKIGFTERLQFSKENGIDAISMELDVK